jgi:hypothetical protein
MFSLRYAIYFMVSFFGTYLVIRNVQPHSVWICVLGITISNLSAYIYGRAFRRSDV